MTQAELARTIGAEGLEDEHVSFGFLKFVFENSVRSKCHIHNDSRSDDDEGGAVEAIPKGK